MPCAAQSGPEGGAPHGQVARVALVGHYGPDAAMLASTVRRALPGAEVIRVSDDTRLAEAAPVCDLLLVNRRLDGEFSAPDGVALIASLDPGRRARAMLISNYEEAQARAVAAGAAPGFGKAAANTPGAAGAIRAAAGRR